MNNCFKKGNHPLIKEVKTMLDSKCDEEYVVWLSYISGICEAAMDWTCQPVRYLLIKLPCQSCLVFTLLRLKSYLPPDLVFPKGCPTTTATNMMVYNFQYQCDADHIG